jgi:hypothetical protein
MFTSDNVHLQAFTTTPGFLHALGLLLRLARQPAEPPSHDGGQKGRAPTSCLSSKSLRWGHLNCLRLVRGGHS